MVEHFPYALKRTENSALCQQLAKKENFSTNFLMATKRESF